MKGMHMMPDDMFEGEREETGGFSEVIMGEHKDVLLHLQPTQTQQLIDFMKQSGVFTNDNYTDDLDAPNDILQHIHKLKPQQYAEYVMLVGSFDGPDNEEK